MMVHSFGLITFKKVLNLTNISLRFQDEKLYHKLLINYGVVTKIGRLS
jgi:hypothetical protein